MTRAYLGLGSNLGNRGELLADALRRLQSGTDIRLEAVSPTYETRPVGRIDQPDFLNLVAAVGTELSPLELLGRCRTIESDLGREREERWGPRTIDIDILVFGDITSDDPELTLPHPRMCERGFVLVPLATLAPDLVVNGRTVREWATAGGAAGVRRIGDPFLL